MKKLYITTAIDYVNGDPHLGHALEKVQADVLARHWRRKLGDEHVRFQTGTDEHGSKNYRAAREVGESPEVFTERQSRRFQDLKGALGISWDYFIRTSDRETHWPGAQELWRRIEAAGDLYKKTYGGWYCVGCEAFKTEREIRDKHCLIHPARELEWVEEENWFFRLSRYRDALLKHFESHPDFIQPEHRRREILNVIRGGLEDVSFSRPKATLPWGVPVPGDEEQVMYVWCDALSNYITGIGFPDEKRLREWWGGENHVTHVIGKDILRFHAAIWPAMLLSAGLPLPNTIFVHGFIHTGGEKLSKTTGVAVDPFALVERYGTDALRYYLLREIPWDGDGEFSVGRFEELYAADLANNLGNLVQRVATLIERNLDGRIDPSVEAEILPRHDGKDPDALIEEKKFNLALQALWTELDRLNASIEQEKPWKLAASNPERLKEVLSRYAKQLVAIGDYLEPFLPETAVKIIDTFSDEKIAAPSAPLFPRLDH